MTLSTIALLGAAVLLAVYVVSRSCPRHTRVTLDEVERRYPQVHSLPFSYGRTWATFKQTIQPGDSLRLVSSSPSAWRRCSGKTVLEVVRDKSVVASIPLERS